MRAVALQMTGVAAGLVLWAVGLSQDLEIARELHAVEEGGASVPPVASYDFVIADTIPDAVTRIVQRNIFQPNGAPATASANQIAAVSPTPAPVRPILLLRGIVGGPPWSAVVQGVPGREGAVVMRLADTLSGLRISAIRRDTVVVRSTDTTWTLSLPRR